MSNPWQITSDEIAAIIASGPEPEGAAPIPVQAQHPPTTLDELKAYLAHKNEQIQGASGFLVPHLDKFMMNCILLMLLTNEAMLDKLLAAVQQPGG